MTKAEKLYEMTENKDIVLSLMYEFCPSEYGMSDKCDDYGEDCFLCWMEKVSE